MTGLNDLSQQEGWVGHEDEESALQERVGSDVSELGEKSCHEPHERPHQETGAEYSNKVQDSLGYVPVPVVAVAGIAGNTTSHILLVILQGLHQHDGHGVVEDGLPEHQGVKVDVHVHVWEDGEDGDGVCGGYESPEVEVVYEGDILEVGSHLGDPVHNSCKYKLLTILFSPFFFRPPTVNVLMAVPMKAKVNMEPMFRKKYFFFMA